MRWVSRSPVACTAALTAGLIVAISAGAETVVPKSACTAPSVPAQFRDGQHQSRFSDAARVYEQCIKDYVGARQKSAAAHAKAGNDAAGQFNQFAAKVAAIEPPPPR